MSERTVKIVPLTGFLTAENATFSAESKMFATSFVPISSHSLMPSQTPRKICDVMTPELPRAPIRAPVVIARQSSSFEKFEPSATMFSSTLLRVSDMFVPVSPSGTGKTFSLLTSSSFSASACAAKMNAREILEMSILLSFKFS